MSDSLNKRYEENLLLSVEQLADFILDDAVTDLYINPGGKLFIKRFGQPRCYTERIISADTIKRIIIFVASMTNQVVNEKHPVLQAVMPYYDMRIHAFIPPWVTSPSLCIRKKNKKVIPLSDFVSENRLTASQFAFLNNCILERKNIIIAGSTGSGKTTLLNSLIDTIALLCPHQRLFIVEDTGEITCSAPDYVSLCVSPGQTVQAVRSALRYNPDRIIFGELRYGATAFELLKAWKTDHPGGLTTIHAESTELVLSRLSDLISECVAGQITESMFAESIQVIVFLKDTGTGGPQVSCIAAVKADKDTNKILYSKIL